MTIGMPLSISSHKSGKGSTSDAWSTKLTNDLLSLPGSDKSTLHWLNSIHTPTLNLSAPAEIHHNSFPPSRPTMTQQRSILKTPLVLLVLMSATVSQAVVSPDACMQNGFVLPDVPECTFGALSEAFARVLSARNQAPMVPRRYEGKEERQGWYDVR